MTSSDTAPYNAVFEEPWWLDAVAPGQWREALVSADGRVVARLPYVPKHRAGRLMVVQPPFTPALGPWIAPFEGRVAKRLAREKELTGALIAQLPAADVFEQALSPVFTNGLPFHWAGWDIAVRYTYRLADLTDPERIWRDMLEARRRSVRKAERGLTVRPATGPDELLAVLAHMQARTGTAIDRLALRRIQAAAANRGRCEILLATDAAERVHAAALFVWDGRWTYYLAGGRDERLPDAGGASLLLWRGIQAAAARGQGFDFEGSMIEPIERFFRGFGADQVPYLRVSRRSAVGQAFLIARSAARRLRDRR